MQDLTLPIKLVNKFKSLTVDTQKQKSQEKAMNENQKWMISFKDWRKQKWDIFILIFAIYNSIYVPYSITYDQDHNGPNYVTQNVADILVDVVFTIDIILMFFTSYENKQGKEVFDRNKVRKHYVYTFGFFTDFMSVLGNNLF